MNPMMKNQQQNPFGQPQSDLLQQLMQGQMTGAPPGTGAPFDQAPIPPQPQLQHEGTMPEQPLTFGQDEPNNDRIRQLLMQLNGGQ